MPKAAPPSALRRRISSTATISMVRPPKKMPSGKAMNCKFDGMGARRTWRLAGLAQARQSVANAGRMNRSSHAHHPPRCPAGASGEHSPVWRTR